MDLLSTIVQQFGWLDLALLLAMTVSALQGWRRGASVQTAALGGAVGGVLVGRWLVAGGGDGPLLGQVIAVIVGALVGAALGGRVGAPVGSAARVAGLGWLDAGLGAAVRASLALVALWFVAAIVTASGSPQLVTALNGSAVLARLDAALPEPARLTTSLLGARTARLIPVGLAEPRVASDALTARAAEAAVAGTVKIVGTACGQGVAGSGFAVGGDLVVTNAHVVRGTSGPSVLDRGGAHRSTVVGYDPSLDLAVLRVDGLAAEELTVRRGVAAPGTQGAVLGFPGGGALRVSSATVAVRTPTVVRSSDGRGVRLRETYRVRTIVRPGNSGGPFVDRRGRVLGVVTARLVGVRETGLAISSPHVRAALDDLSAGSPAVGTGRCATR